MKVTKTLMAICLVPAFVAACSSKSNDNVPQNVEAATTEPGLQNKVFRGECSLNPIQAIVSGIATAGDNSVKSSITMYEFNGANVTHSTHVFQSADCSGTEALVYKEAGSFKILDDQRTKDGDKAIDLDYDKLTLQTLDAVGAQIANQLKLCGAQDWAAGQEEREVSSMSKELNCYAVELPRRVMDVYRTDGGTLYFGSRSSRIFKDRPTSVDMDAPYRH